MSELIIIYAPLFLCVFVLIFLLPKVIRRFRRNSWVDNGSIDYASVNRANRLNETLARGNTSIPVPTWETPEKNAAQIAEKKRNLAAKRNAKKTKTRTRQLSTAHRIILFTDGPLSELNDRSGVLLFDLLASLGIEVETVDVSKNFTLRLGIPTKNEKPNLPHLFIDGMAVSDAKTTLDMVKSGELFEWFDRGKIDYDKTVAKALRAS